MIQLGEPQFKIPKISVPIVCHMLSGEKLSGEIFIDSFGSQDYSSQQINDFFNDQPPFFPLRIDPKARPILVQKESVVNVEIVGMMKKFESETSFTLAIKKEAVLHQQGIGSVKATIILDMPEEHSRLLDLLNIGKRFFPVVIENSYALLNAHQIYKIEEV